MTPFVLPGCFQFLEDPHSADPFLEWYGRYDERRWRPFRHLARLVRRSEPTAEPRRAACGDARAVHG
jgi:hypothetical protein